MVIVSNKKTYSIINEAAHRKRARYQNGLESNSYLGENVVSPQPLFYVSTPLQEDGVL